MKRFHWGVLGAASIAAIGSFAACSSDGDGGGGECTPGVDLGCPGGGGSGGGASGGTGGGSPGDGPYCQANPDEYGCTKDIGDCFPTDSSCYLANGVGDECMAQRDNSKGATDRVQYRQTWARSLKPAGLIIDAIYDILRKGASLPDPTCNSNGTSGFLQLIDTNLAGSDISQHTTRTGFAPWIEADQVAGVTSSGLCMIDDMFENAAAVLPADQLGSTEGWPAGLVAPMQLPYHVKPLTLKRVADDFTVGTQREQLLSDITAAGADGFFYLNDDTGENHSYVPLAWVVTYTIAPENFVAIPFREVETHMRPNDANERSCIGSFRGGDLDTATCDSTVQTNPQWGCPGDIDCDPGESPAKVEGYFLITELEQVQSSTLGQTLCVLYPGGAEATADGFNCADPTLGSNCRTCAGWNPSDPVNGLPHGDWCAKTNSKATADCHDAFRNETWQAFQGFNISDDTCTF
jgi:hypothetical protein